LLKEAYPKKSSFNYEESLLRFVILSLKSVWVPFIKNVVSNREPHFTSHL
jgi:hypothetical protein